MERVINGTQNIRKWSIFWGNNNNQKTVKLIEYQEILEL